MSLCCLLEMSQSFERGRMLANLQKTLFYLLFPLPLLVELERDKLIPSFSAFKNILLCSNQIRWKDSWKGYFRMCPDLNSHSMFRSSGP